LGIEDCGHRLSPIPAEEMSQHWLESFVGAKLLKGNQEQISTSTCQGKYIGLYFSAHWCPPCQRFTPMLATLYQNFKKLEKDFEVIYCSLDRNPDEFQVLSCECHICF
jgi:thiol-disulfide isomerase/thioredoxin